MIEKYECPECKGRIEWDNKREDEYIQCPYCNSKLRSLVAATFSAGTIIGDYEIIKRLGIGGMGEVYLAEQKSMMRPVALKVLRKELVENQSYLERFYREVRTLAQIEHPNIVKAIEAGYEEKTGVCYFSMRYIEGEDLKKRLDSEKKIPEEDVLNIVMHVGLALQYVWDKYKLIHRDIKPANIIVTKEGEVKLMDLGISKSMKEDARADLTMAGVMVGSPYYISPEQARAEKEIDFHADMYSLGVSFYHLLTGQLPFDSESSMSIIASHLTDPVPDLKKIVPEISDHSVKIIRKMMEKSKDSRYSTWDDALNDIEEAINRLATVGVGKTTSLQSAVLLRGMQSPEQLPVTAVPSATVADKTATKDAVSMILCGFPERLFANLYIRFITLVTLLFLTFVASFFLIKSSIAESKAREAKRRMDSAMVYISTMPKTEQGFRKAYNLLIDVKKIRNKKYDKVADDKLKQVKKSYLQLCKKAKKREVEKALRVLKSRAYELENSGDLKGALRVWEEYQTNGSYANELKTEIRDAITYHKRKVVENSTDNGRID